MPNKILKVLSKKISNLLYKPFFLYVFKKAKTKNLFPFTTNFMIISIAFNDPEMIRIQHKNLEIHLKDSFDYIVVDNSNKKEASDEIESFCKTNNISYIKLPKNILTNIRRSGSHGMALNWCYRNIVKKYKPKYFGLLDHDIFPVREVRILEKMKNGFWGVIRTKKEVWWYFWPGFSFFEYEKMKKYKFDFFPYHADKNGFTFLDTGGSNYNSISRKIQRDSVAEVESLIIDIPTKKQHVIGKDSSQTFEIIDRKWIHIRQISWREESFNKMNLFNDILNITNEVIDNKIEV